MSGAPELYALAAEFDDPERLLEAARAARAEGYRKLDAYSPFAVHGLDEALDIRDRRVARFVLAGGLLGGIGGYFMQWWAAVIDYPINVGNRPLHSWPAFVPLTFELTILLAGITATLVLFWLNGLPMPYHPMFNVPAFARASQDRFFLAIEAEDPRFDEAKTRRFLKSQHALEVHDVPA